MKRPSKDQYYLEIARAVSRRSTCLKRQYGCVIVQNDVIVATGYNGSPRGYSNCCDTGECIRLDMPHNSGDYSDCNAVHAEQNAIMAAGMHQCAGARMYLVGFEKIEVNRDDDGSVIVPRTKTVEITAIPCPICERMIINAGIGTAINKDGEFYWA